MIPSTFGIRWSARSRGPPVGSGIRASLARQHASFFYPICAVSDGPQTTTLMHFETIWSTATLTFTAMRTAQDEQETAREALAKYGTMVADLNSVRIVAALYIRSALGPSLIISMQLLHSELIRYLFDAVAMANLADLGRVLARPHEPRLLSALTLRAAKEINHCNRLVTFTKSKLKQSSQSIIHTRSSHEWTSPSLPRD